MRIKICGITQADQAQAIAHCGATSLGFICVKQSPRYVAPERIRELTTLQPIDRVGVFVDASVAEIERVAAIAQLTAAQLHGNESPQFCQALRAALPAIEIIKAFRVRNAETLEQTRHYENCVDALLLDAYHPHVTNPGLLGGTGKTLNWDSLKQFRPRCPWLLAGGITPDNIVEALKQVQPDGIDLSSGVEFAPGDKDLAAVERLFVNLQCCFNVSKNA
ncbi:MAG: phosphoribosylanthranilate isomerase [Leptolyngbyaceae cyanobacterium CSU_1_4]|nr:phosphoribosylanthranilate isomerase [Leptolyngbyaceae cyanobacterium CSU_1_4]